MVRTDPPRIMKMKTWRASLTAPRPPRQPKAFSGELHHACLLATRSACAGVYVERWHGACRGKGNFAEQRGADANVFGCRGTADNCTRTPTRSTCRWRPLRQGLRREEPLDGQQLVGNPYQVELSCSGQAPRRHGALLVVVVLLPRCPVLVGISPALPIGTKSAVIVDMTGRVVWPSGD